MDKKPLLALIQHPMWLLIKEDSTCLERTPPWGAPSVEAYSTRVERNLDTLEQHPEARVNYDFSGVELEDIRAMFPRIAERIEAAIARSQIQIVNGTYSQAHLHTLSLEAAIRQFQYGLKVIQEFGQPGVSSYIIQEPGFTDQIPQLLDAFGFRYCAKSCFPVYQKTLDANAVLSPDDFFCRWRGLDGTEILTISGLDWYHLDMRRKLSDGTDFAIFAPDLVEMSTDEHRYVLLDEVLPAEEKVRKQEKTPFKAIRQYVPWSYLEGTDGEQLVTLDTACETALVQMETVNALLGIGQGARSDALWKVWLTCQHHDAYWSGAPDLREKCCTWLKQTIAEAGDAVKTSLRFEQSNRPELVCFSIYPKEHKGVIAVDWEGAAPERFTDDEGSTYPVQLVANGDNSTLLVEYAFTGAGPGVLIPSGVATPQGSEVLTRDYRYSNAYYSALFRADGSIPRIAAGNTDFPVRAASTLGAVTALVDGTTRNLNEHVLETAVQRGPVADILRIKARIGDVPVLRTVTLYHNLPWFESELEFDFSDTVMGEYNFDVNKLNLIFPLQRGAKLVHGIGGGYSVPDEPETAFFPVNWVDVASGGVGLSIINFGTRKHWVKEHTLGITLAWGGKTAYFGNRVEDASLTTRMAKEFDLRLNGKRTFRYAVYPHQGGWMDASVSDIAMSLLRPPVVMQGRANVEGREARHTLGITGNVVPTSVFERDGKLVCRVYEPDGREPVYDVKVNGQEARTEWTDATGKKTEGPKPFGIGNVVIAAMKGEDEVDFIRRCLESHI